MKPHQFKKSLGLLDATLLVSGSMIGSGIFLVSTDMSLDLGSSGWLLVTWLLTGVITLFGALSYGELAAMFPEAGGQFVYLNKAFGRLPAFLYGWSVFTIIQTGVIAAVAVAFGKFTGVFFPELTKSIFVYNFGDAEINVTYCNLVGVFCILLLTFLNNKGIHYGKIIQLVFTGSKLIALFALIIAGIIIGIKSGYFAENFSDPWYAEKTTITKNGVKIEELGFVTLLIAISTTIINSLFSSDAWNNVTYITGEIRDPEKNLPRSLFLGTFIVTVIYILANVAYLGLLPLKGQPIDASLAFTDQGVRHAGMQFANEGRVGIAASYMVMGDVAQYIMAALIMISTFGCNNGIILAGARLFYVMACQGMFFKKAAQLNKAEVPQFAIWLQCAWACILCMTGSYKILIIFATFASLFFYFFTISGLFVLRKKMPNHSRPYKAFGYPIVPALYLLLILWVLFFLTVFMFWYAIASIVFILLGIPVYYFFIKHRISA